MSTDAIENRVTHTPSPSAVNTNEPSMPPNPNAVAEAVERRMRQAREAQELTAYTDFDENYEKRREFRRLIDPGILRPNPRHVALEALRILLKLSRNILENPGNKQFHRFKPTNLKIKQYLVDPKGTIEYAVALGFRTQVENFQPYYVFNTAYMTDLRVGVSVLEEALEREDAKEREQERARRDEKAVSEAAIKKVKQAFLDDRKSKAQQDRMEKQTREAKAARRPPLPPASPIVISGAGRTLRDGSPTTTSPPAYPSDDD